MTDHPATVPAGKPTSYSRVTLSRIMTAVDVNLYGTVHGGVLMKFVDDVAGAAAARHSGGTAVTAAIDEIVFSVPVRVGRPGARARPGQLDRQAPRWRSACGWSPSAGTRPSDEPVNVATAYLVFVGVDVGGAPRAVRPVLPETPGGRAPLPRGGDPPRAPAGPPPGHRRHRADAG